MKEKKKLMAMVTEELHEEFKNLAKELNMSMKQFILDALKEKMQKYIGKELPKEHFKPELDEIVLTLNKKAKRS